MQPLRIFLFSLFAACCLPDMVTPGVTLKTKYILSWLGITDGKVAIGSQHVANQSGWEVQRKISGYSPIVSAIEYRDFAGIEKDLVYWEWSRNLFVDIFRKGGILTIVDYKPNFSTGSSSHNNPPRFTEPTFTR